MLVLFAFYWPLLFVLHLPIKKKNANGYSAAAALIIRSINPAIAIKAPAASETNTEAVAVKEYGQIFVFRVRTAAVVCLLCADAIA